MSSRTLPAWTCILVHVGLWEGECYGRTSPHLGDEAEQQRTQCIQNASAVLYSSGGVNTILCKAYYDARSLPLLPPALAKAL